MLALTERKRLVRTSFMVVVVLGMSGLFLVVEIGK